MALASGSDTLRPGGRDAPLSVSAVVKAANGVLERAVGTIWVEGETASVARPASGHIYFTLRDQRARMRAVMWRSDARRLRFRMEDGLTIRCRGRLGVYDREGTFQFYVQMAEPAGLGAEALALEQLRARLAAEGLFDAERKRPLPLLPRRIGVVTSKSGAAVRDIIRAIQGRFPVPILVADTVVQGTGAPAQIAAAISAIAETDVDVVIVGRGGGSAGDLAAFNDEAVVRAVAACPIPTVSAVGHEVDISLTDLAADHRAATPTMAGAMVVPVLAELQQRLEEEERRLSRELEFRLRGARQEIDQIGDAMRSSVAEKVARHRQLLGDLRHRLDARHPLSMLAVHRSALRDLESRAERLARRRVEAASRDYAALAGRLEALSPLRVLQRGYALATAVDSGGRRTVVTDAATVAVGDDLEVRLAHGRLDCRIEKVGLDE